MHPGKGLSFPGVLVRPLVPDTLCAQGGALYHWCHRWMEHIAQKILLIVKCTTLASPGTPTLSFHYHIKSITKSAFFHLKNISHRRPSLSDSVVETLIHAFITSRLDYCNGVLSGVPSKILDRVLTRTKPWLHISPHPHPSAMAPHQIPWFERRFLN